MVQKLRRYGMVEIRYIIVTDQFSRSSRPNTSLLKFLQYGTGCAAECPKVTEFTVP